MHPWQYPLSSLLPEIPVTQYCVGNVCCIIVLIILVFYLCNERRNLLLQPSKMSCSLSRDLSFVLWIAKHQDRSSLHLTLTGHSLLAFIPCSPLQECQSIWNKSGLGSHCFMRRLQFGGLSDLGWCDAKPPTAALFLAHVLKTKSRTHHSAIPRLTGKGGMSWKHGRQLQHCNTWEPNEY